MTVQCPLASPEIETEHNGAGSVPQRSPRGRTVEAPGFSHGVLHDAIQLASALLIRSKLAVIGVPTLSFVSADVELLSIASDEGLGVENPIAR